MAVEAPFPPIVVAGAKLAAGHLANTLSYGSFSARFLLLLLPMMRQRLCVVGFSCFLRSSKKIIILFVKIH